MEFTKKGVNKGTKIPQIREYFRTNGKNDIKLYCLGDYGNDVDMLLRADKAFCPSNAIDAVKNICHHVLCNHDEGAISDLIEK